MPKDLHPQVQVLIDRAQELGLQSLQHLDLAAARAQVEGLAQARRATYPPPEVHAVENTSTGPGYGHVPVRIYRVSDAGSAPVVVYYHGGGHVVCSLDTHDTIARFLALKVGCTLVSVDYRMGPEYPFPAGVEDSYNATRWVSDNAEALRVDPRRLAVCGDSAGANLAAVVALLARDSGDVEIAAQSLIYPVIDYRGGTGSYDRYGTGYGSLEAETVRWFMGHYLPDPALRDDWRACPANAKLDARLPPTQVLTAECDVLHDEGEAFAHQLRAAGVSVQHRDFKGLTHGFFGFLGLVDAAEEAHAEVAGFLNDTWRNTSD